MRYTEQNANHMEGIYAKIKTTSRQRNRLTLLTHRTGREIWKGTNFQDWDNYIAHKIQLNDTTNTKYLEIAEERRKHAKETNANKQLILEIR